MTMGWDGAWRFFLRQSCWLVEELYDVSSSVESNFLELGMFLLIHLKLKGLKTFNIVQDVFVQCFLICTQNVIVIWKVLLQMCEC